MKRTFLTCALVLSVIGAVHHSAPLGDVEDTALRATSCAPGNFASFHCYAALV